MTLDEHMQQSIEAFGAGHEDLYRAIHLQLDQFAHFPDDWFLKEHRKFLHNQEGVDYFRMRYGDFGGRIAELHIIKDCGHVPMAIDYYTGRVNRLGWKPRVA